MLIFQGVNSKARKVRVKGWKEKQVLSLFWPTVFCQVGFRRISEPTILQVSNVQNPYDIRLYWLVHTVDGKNPANQLIW